MRRFCIVLCLIVALFGMSVSANATLTTIGTASYNGNDYNLIFEGELGNSGLVWLDYTRSYDTWQNQSNWASGLGLYLTVDLDPAYMATIEWNTGWRLPETDESQANLSLSRQDGFGYWGPDDNGYHDYLHGYNMVNSEMGRLFYISLGNTGYQLANGSYPSIYGLQNADDFINLDPDLYWHGTEISSSSAWRFNLNTGGQGYGYDKSRAYKALAVHSGEVFSTPTPEPSTLLLLGTGILGIFGLTRRKLKKSKLSE